MRVDVKESKCSRKLALHAKFPRKMQNDELLDLTIEYLKLTISIKVLV